MTPATARVTDTRTQGLAHMCLIPATMTWHRTPAGRLVLTARWDLDDPAVQDAYRRSAEYGSGGLTDTQRRRLTRKPKGER